MIRWIVNLFRPYTFEFSTRCDGGSIKVAVDTKTGEAFLNDSVDPHPLGAVCGDHPLGWRSVWYDEEGRKVGWWKAGFLRIAFKRWDDARKKRAHRNYIKNLLAHKKREYNERRK